MGRWFDLRSKVPPRPLLRALDRDLDRVGVHTAADAKLLRALGARKGRVAALSEGLANRAERSVREYDRALKVFEAQVFAHAPGSGEGTALEADFTRLARATKVADLFAAPALEAPFEIYPRPSVRWATPPTQARVAIAELLDERARRNPVDLRRRRDDLEAAHELLLRAGADADRDRIRPLRLRVAEARERSRAMGLTRSLEELTSAQIQYRVVPRRRPE